MDLLLNIPKNFYSLRDDFIGFSIAPTAIVSFIFHLLLTIGFFLLFYCLGEKIRKKFFQKTKYRIFISICLGYILVGTGMGLLGFFSLFSQEVLVLYLLVLIVAAFYPFPTLEYKKLNIKKLTTIIHPKKSLITWGVLLFICIAFLRLMTPEITEDGYHTDIPQLFLSSQTTLLASHDELHTIPFPKLPEMIYSIAIFLTDKEAVRFIHFGFYILIIFLLFAFSKQKKYAFAAFLPLLFVTTPVVIRYSSTQHTDFFAIFAFFTLCVFD